jgi:hypothetical protein
MILEIAGGIITAVILLWLGALLSFFAREIAIGATVLAALAGVWYLGRMLASHNFMAGAVLMGIAFIAPWLLLAWWVNRDRWAARWKEWREGN